jgi:hypothetical protein
VVFPPHFVYPLNRIVTFISELIGKDEFFIVFECLAIIDAIAVLREPLAVIIF